MSRIFLIAGVILALLVVGCEKDKPTKSNSPPFYPISPSPPDGATNQPTDVDLSWIGGDPDDDPVTYDLYLGTKSSPPLLASGLVQTSYDPGILNENTQYYWKIVSKDNRGGQTTGPIWTFTTGAGSGYGNVVEVESVNVNSGSSVEVGVFFDNIVELSAIAVPLQYSSNDIIYDSMSFIGSRIGYLGTKGSNIKLEDRLVVIYGIVMLESYIPVGSGLLGKIYFTIPHPMNTVVEIDTCFFPPATKLELVDYLAAPITPQFIPGKIVIHTQ